MVNINKSLIIKIQSILIIFFFITGEYSFLFSRFNNEIFNLGPYQYYHTALFSYPGVSFLINSSLGIDRIFLSQFFDVNIYYIILKYLNDSYQFYLVIKLLEIFTVYFLIFKISTEFLSRNKSYILLLILSIDGSFLHILHLSISYSLIFFYLLMYIITKIIKKKKINSKSIYILSILLFIQLFSFTNYGILILLSLFFYYLYGCLYKKNQEIFNLKILSKITFNILILLCCFLIILYYAGYLEELSHFLKINFYKTSFVNINDYLNTFKSFSVTILLNNNGGVITVFLILCFIIILKKNNKIDFKLNELKTILITFISVYFVLFLLSPGHFYLNRVSLISPILLIFLLVYFQKEKILDQLLLLIILNYIFINFYTENFNNKYILILINFWFLIFCLIFLLIKLKHYSFIRNINLILLFGILLININSSIDVSKGLISNERGNLINEINHLINRDIELKNYKKILTNIPSFDFFSYNKKINFITNTYAGFESKKFDFGVDDKSSNIAIILLSDINDYLKNIEIIRYKSHYYKIFKKSKLNENKIYYFLPIQDSEIKSNKKYYYDDITKEEINYFINLIN